MDSAVVALALNDVIFAWALFAAGVVMVFGGLYLAVFKPWKKSFR